MSDWKVYACLAIFVAGVFGFVAIYHHDKRVICESRGGEYHWGRDNSICFQKGASIDLEEKP